MMVSEGKSGKLDRKAERARAKASVSRRAVSMLALFVFLAFFDTLACRGGDESDEGKALEKVFWLVVGIGVPSAMSVSLISLRALASANCDVKSLCSPERRITLSLADLSCFRKSAT